MFARTCGFDSHLRHTVCLMRNLQQVVSVASLLDATRLGAIAQSGCAIDRECWRRILGERIAERSAPNTIHGGALTVKVASSVWAQELSLLAPEILQRLQNAGFSTTELRRRAYGPRIVALIPPLYHPLLRYFGVFGPHSSWRKSIAPEVAQTAEQHHEHAQPSAAPTSESTSRVDSAFKTSTDVTAASDVLAPSSKKLIESVGTRTSLQCALAY